MIKKGARKKIKKGTRRLARKGDKKMARQRELAYLLIDYLTDWVEDEEDRWSIKQSTAVLKSYGSSFDKPDDTLVKSALHHFINIVNPWNRNAVPSILEEMGFSESEIELYWTHLYDDEDEKEYPYSVK